jgi:hypothetical protein
MLDLLDQVIAKMKLVGAGSASAATSGAGNPLGIYPSSPGPNGNFIYGGGSVPDLSGALANGTNALLPTSASPSVTTGVLNKLNAMDFGSTASYGTSQFAANNASTTSSNAPSTAGTTTVNLNVDGHTIATAVLPSVTQGILQNQISGKSIVYSGFSV